MANSRVISTPSGFSKVGPKPILAFRAPQTSDQGEVGQVWIDQTAQKSYGCVYAGGGVFVWSETTVSAASTTVAGITAYSTNAQALTGTSTTAALTPSNIGPYARATTWTPTITAATPPGAITYTLQYGKYTRVGDVVYCFARIVVNTFTLGGGTGDLRIAGFPFPSNSDTNANGGGSVVTSGVTLPAATVSAAFESVGSGTSYGRIMCSVSTNPASPVVISGLAAGSSIQVDFKYFTA